MFFIIYLHTSFNGLLVIAIILRAKDILRRVIPIVRVENYMWKGSQ